MTKPALINHDEIVDASNTSYIIQGHRVHRLEFVHTTGDDITNQSNNDTLYLRNAATSNTITDQGLGLHINIDGSSLLTTVRGFQNDPYGVIELTTNSFTSIAAIANALEVVPGFGTVLGAQFKGPVVMSFQGDYDVKLSQFHLSRAS